MTESGPAIARTRGALDAVALGEWVHAGDAREALGEPGSGSAATAADPADEGRRTGTGRWPRRTGPPIEADRSVGHLR
ncbi:hypothetical protein ACFYW8_10360 [Streptomyces sp. NPDC002742]|uniref:hypothetical protein n=1 Tax=Streptomyces sp. NPDC002742 TaxID=3364663 RepID=UPI00369A4D87